MKSGVVIFPGSNCDEDMVAALERISCKPVTRLWHKEADVQGCDLVVLPGGFSYGDYLRCGAIARFSPVMTAVAAHAKKGGYLLGVCNGFQILTEASLLPGALLRNISQKFQCHNQRIAAVRGGTPLTRNAQGRVLNIPIAHAEGRYYADEATLNELVAHEQILYKYVDDTGTEADDANPNGSARHIAGVMNRVGNVFGLMPHPERAADAALRNTDGLALLGGFFG